MVVTIDVLSISNNFPLEVVKVVPNDAMNTYSYSCQEYLVPPGSFWGKVKVPDSLKDQYKIACRDPLASHGVRYTYMSDEMFEKLNPICETQKDDDNKFIFYSFLSQREINERAREQKWWERLWYRSTLDWVISLYTVVKVRKMRGNEYINITRDDMKWLGICPPSVEACLGNF